MKHSTRLLLLALIAALTLSGCGLFGGDSAGQASASEVSASATVRVNSGDRFFDIDPSSLFTEDGNLTSTALDELAERVMNLSLGMADPTNAGVIFEGGQFVVNPSIPGSTPDIEAIAAQLSDSEVTSINIELIPIPAEVSDQDAADFAAELNENLATGIDVRIEGVGEVLDPSTVGDATTVDVLNGEFVVSVDYQGIANELERMFSEISTEGTEATFDIIPSQDGTAPATVEIVPGEPAMVCCGDGSADRVVRALTGDANVANLSLVETDAERGVAWAEGLEINEVVASFTTRYTAGQDRNINIQRIAELTQGMIIEPGQTWSLNDEIGQRTIANGFVESGSIVNGHLTESVGGGISQYATTLFNASFFAGLEFDDYQSHSIYFSRYPYGREATISWPAPQLEIYNPTPYGILIWPTTTSNSITVELYSTAWVEAEQTGQIETQVQEACTRVTTERTRNFLDGTTDVDTVFAIYREEGIGCDGEETVDPDAPPTTTTTAPPPTTTTLVPEGQNPDDEEPAEQEPEPTAPQPVNPDDGEPEPADPPQEPETPPDDGENPPADEGETPPDDGENPPADPEETPEEPENPPPDEGEQPVINPEEAP